MAILSNNTGIGLGYNDPRYWDNASSHDRYYDEMRRQQARAMQQQQMYYNPNTDMYMGGVTSQQIQEGTAQKPKETDPREPAHLKNKTLLLLD